MVLAGRDGDGARVEVNGAKARHLAGRVALVVSAVVAKLSLAAATPALDAAAVEDRAGVGTARAVMASALVPRFTVPRPAISPTAPPLSSELP